MEFVINTGKYYWSPSLIHCTTVGTSEHHGSELIQLMEGTDETRPADEQTDQSQKHVDNADRPVDQQIKFSIRNILHLPMDTQCGDARAGKLSVYFSYSRQGNLT